MKTKSLFGIFAGFLLLTGCSGGSTPLKDLAETYAEIADNNQEVNEAFQAVYKASRDQQQTLQEKAIATSESVKAKNERLAEKAASLGEKLQGQEIKCEASTALGVKVTSATFTTVNTQDKLANIVITAEVEGTPNGAPYFLLMTGDEVLYKSAANYSDGKITVNFRITTNKESEVARAIAKTQSVMLITQAEYAAGGVSDEVTTAESQESTESEPVYQGNDDANTVDEASVGDVKIEKGANIVAVLKAAKGVT